MTDQGQPSLAEARDLLAEEWLSLNPQTPEEIADFYRNTRNYDADLDAWHSDPDRQAWSTICVGVAKASNAKMILDIGAGAGHDLRVVQEAVPDAHLMAIEPNRHLAERLWNAGITVVDVFDEESPMQFDMIMCLDVLEHLPEPEVTLEIVRRHLKPGGNFVEATATHDIGTPLHLASLRGWSPARFLDRHGFTIRDEFGEGRLRIWTRDFESRPNEANLLLCAYRSLSAETLGSVLRLMDHGGWRRSVHRGDALVSRVRSIAVSQWLQEDDGDVFLMVDDDIVFTPEDAQKVVELARRTKGIASAAYPVRGGSHLASRVPVGNLQFGPELEPIEITWAGTGFFAVHREVCEAIAAQTPLCMLNDQIWFWPMFQPFVYENEDRGYNEYLSEDWSFCERARKLGFKVWLDRSVILTHIGTAEYSVYNMTSSVIQAPPTDGGI